MQTIDVTPSWSAILPILIYGLENSDPQLQKYSKEELHKMAVLADKAVELLSPNP